ncbi:partial Serine-aspartate repeat-containing protein D, partial [Thermoflexales bacterium]
MYRQSLPRFTWTIGLTILISVIFITAPAVFAASGAESFSPSIEPLQLPRARSRQVIKKMPAVCDNALPLTGSDYASCATDLRDHSVSDVLAVTSGITDGQPVIAAYFSGANLEGWSVNAGALQNPGSGGNDAGSSDGYIRTSAPGDSITSYFVAPPRFHGDWRNYIELKFALWSSGGSYYSSGYSMHGDVYLASGSKTAYRMLPRRPATTWDPFTVLLADTVGWTLGGGATSLTEVLSNITNFQIRAEYGVGTDQAALDSVELFGSILPGPAATLELSSVPTQTVAGASLALTVTLRDGLGDIATEYTGTVQFSSSDPQATLPTTYTFAAGNAGQHLFSGMMLRTVGAQTITATDVNSPALRSVVTINVLPGNVSASLSQLNVTSPHRADGSAAATIILTATDAYSNVVPGQTVWLVATGLNHTFTALPGTTNAAGVFSTTLTSTQAGAKEIRALVGSGQSYTWVVPGAFVEFTRSSITGTVFSDANRDNVQQVGELGLGAVQVAVYAASDSTPLKTTVTNPTGQYQFTGLEAGTYRVVQTPLDQFAFSVSGVLTVTLGDFTTSANHRFGNYAAAQVTGEVWSDNNQDGSRQAGEPAIPGVTISAYDGNALLAASTTTNLSGTYQLDLAAPLPAAPDNFIFNSGGLEIQEPATALIANGDFSRGLMALPSAMYPVNYDFETGDLLGWTASNTSGVQVISDVNNLDG